MVILEGKYILVIGRGICALSKSLPWKMAMALHTNGTKQGQAMWKDFISHPSRQRRCREDIPPVGSRMRRHGLLTSW
jgi:enoyl-[acyl-carrier-protein] reductase (NADH)